MKKVVNCILIISLIAFIGCNNLPNIGDKYKLAYNSMGDISLVKGHSEEAQDVVIYGHILDCDFDSTFLVVAERPRDSVQGGNSRSIGKTYNETQKVFKNSSFCQFWIINMTTDSIYGPFNRREFLERCKVYGVSKSLNLDKLAYSALNLKEKCLNRINENKNKSIK